MSSIEPGTWMESKTTPGAYLEVLAVTEDGGVTVRCDGKTTNTTKQYLRATWIPMGDDS